MSSTEGTSRAPKRVSVFAISGLIAAIAMLVTASFAMAGPDPLKGGSTTLAFKSKISKASGGATKAGKTATLPISGGSLDPTNGTGAVQNGGTVTLKKGKKKATLSNIVTTFGTGGSISAKLKGKTVTLASITGGNAGRAGFGGTVSGAAAKLTKKGAKALQKALGGKFKKGKKFATAGISTVPKTVEVVSGSSIASAASGFVKLLITSNPPTPATIGHGVSPATGITVSGGAVFPATTGGGVKTFVTSGSLSPDGTAGKVNYGGALKITKGVPLTPFGYTCDETATGYPLGNFLQIANGSNDFTNGQLLADVTVQAPKVTGAPTPVALGTQIAQAGLDKSTAVVTSDPAAKTITITGLKATVNTQTNVDLLKGIYGPASTAGTNGCGPVGSDVALGETFVTIAQTVTTH